MENTHNKVRLTKIKSLNQKSNGNTEGRNKIIRTNQTQYKRRKQDQKENN